MKKRSLFIALSLLSYASLVHANNDLEKQKRLQQGKVHYEQVCYDCHTTGINDAPRLGNYKDWKEIRHFGKEALLESVIKGKGMMPPRGSSADESAGRYSLMLEYMLSTVKAEDIKTTVEMQKKAELARHLSNGKTLYNMVCANCHTKGGSKVPKIGDKDAWEPRMAKGYDAMVSNVNKGHGGMIRVGGSAIQSIQGVREMVAYMLTTVADDEGGK